MFSANRHFVRQLCRCVGDFQYFSNVENRQYWKLDFCTNNHIFSPILALIHSNTWIKLPILQTIFISAIMNVDFIPSLIQEWNFDPSLHDSQSTFHSGSSVQSGKKNGMNSIRNEFKLDWNSIRIHVNTSYMNQLLICLTFMTCTVK